MSVLVIAEHDNKNLKAFSLNAINAASKIDSDIHVLVAGSKCESVVDYLHILNNVHAFKELREARASGETDALILANYLSQYASKPTYVDLVKEIIQFNLRGVYEL